MNLTVKTFRSLIAVSLLTLISVPESMAQKIPDQVVKSIEFREIGPTRQGGRYVDFAVMEKSPKVIYAATASGGLLKSTNNGQSWKFQFDQESVASIGAVALDQKTLVLYG